MDLSNQFSHSTDSMGYTKYQYMDPVEGHGIVMTVSPEGNLVVNAKANPDMRAEFGGGRDMFIGGMNAIADSGLTVNSITGEWVADTGSTNYEQYMGNRETMSPIESARNTWTGERAAEFGFTNVQTPIVTRGGVEVPFLPESTPGPEIAGSGPDFSNFGQIDDGLPPGLGDPSSLPEPGLPPVLDQVPPYTAGQGAELPGGPQSGIFASYGGMQNALPGLLNEGLPGPVIPGSASPEVAWLQAENGNEAGYPPLTAAELPNVRDALGGAGSPANNNWLTPAWQYPDVLSANPALLGKLPDNDIYPPLPPGGGGGGGDGNVLWIDGKPLLMM
jgi:hypothetical protein